MYFRGLFYTLYHFLFYIIVFYILEGYFYMYFNNIVRFNVRVNVTLFSTLILPIATVSVTDCLSPTNDFAQLLSFIQPIPYYSFCLDTANISP